jgi:hypothetical protein
MYAQEAGRRQKRRERWDEEVKRRALIQTEALRGTAWRGVLWPMGCGAAWRGVWRGVA